MALFLEFLAQQWILVAALLAAIVMLVFHESRKSGPSLSPQQAINLVNAEQGIFLDLREGADFKQGHIADAMHIPAAKLADRMGELLSLGIFLLQHLTNNTLQYCVSGVLRYLKK